MRRLSRLGLAAIAATWLSITGATAAASGSTAAHVRLDRWPEEAIALFERLPVQDGGRIKPLHTYAGFTLLRLNGKRSVTTAAGDALEPVEWLLDTLFFPSQAADHAAFLVQDAEVIEALGLSTQEKRKRDRYTFREIEPGIGRLFALAHDYAAIEEKKRSSVEQQIVFLAGNVDAFGKLATEFDFARARIEIGAESPLSVLFEGRSTVRFSDVVARGPRLAALHATLSSKRSPGASDELGLLTEFLRTGAALVRRTGSLALIPEADPPSGDPVWTTPSELLAQSLAGAAVAPAHLAILRGFESLADACERDTVFASELALQSGRIAALSDARGETRTIGLELAYYKAHLLSTGLAAFVAAFVTAALLWLRPRTRSIYALALACVVAGALCLSAAIVLRCMIRGRPPVSTLYETVLFVTAVGVILGLVLELIDRRRIALSAAAAFGMAGLFVANGYETLDKQDTMPSLVAVLDTNFWLATHVTAITIGYSAGLLAALLASVYLVLKLVRGRRAANGDSFRALARMVYGVLCFGLIFSTVGTILGGIWANESWGRFWGWDPKENGALLIVLSQIAILHARQAGLFREHGLCMAAASGGSVIAFSWWGVNLLGVGLHSYGFTSGIHDALTTYYAIQWGIVVLGGVAAWRERSALRRQRVLAKGPRARLEAGAAEVRDQAA